MIFAPMIAATIVVGVGMSPMINAPAEQLSLQQRNAATQAYVRPATDCIADSVLSDPRFRSDQLTINLGDLIVEAVPKCIEPVRAMIAAYDRYFGEGTGEEFFMGPYLDVLPRMLMKRSKTTAK